ncbi:hypothetical protein [Salipaludibacillus daqingensis]|uniref:hypothetical protein n=1 Tax=Salipaludibacillus daqingensis TaxID=3041001 RepID=UPI002473499E|nr:hypothetical protein [Salipaludibacillus daqingensis]
MRAGYTHEQKGLLSNRLIHSDLYRFMASDSERSVDILGAGLSNPEVRSLKKHLQRN